MNQTHGPFPLALPIDTKIEEFVIQGVVGYGGFGITYRADDTYLGDTVAVKEYCLRDLVWRGEDLVVRPHRHADSETLRWGIDAFLQEARTLARLNHPNLVRVRRYFEALGTAYLVMPMVEGTSMKDILEAHAGNIETGELREVILKLADALAYLHGEGVAHRDIKPENIIVRDDGTPVFVDFGSARCFDQLRSSEFTATVSPGYAPFEQYTGSDRQGPWSDIYALSAVAHFAITGTPPPDAMIRTENDTYTNLAPKARDDIERSFYSAIDAGLRLAPERRPQTIEEFRGIIQSGQHGAARRESTPTIRAPTASSGGTQPNKTKSWAIGLLGGLAVVLIGVFLTVSGVFNTDTLEDPAAPDAAVQTTRTWIVDVNGNGDFPTVAEALERADPLDSVEIRPGRYGESVTLSKAIELIGDTTDPGGVVIDSGDKACLRITDSDATVRSLTLSRNSGGVCVEISGGAPTLASVRVVGAANGGILVTAGEPRFDSVRIEDVKLFGISFEKGGGGEIADSDIVGVQGPGVRIMADSDPVVSNNRIESVAAAGVVVERNGRGQLLDNRIIRSGFSGIEVGGGSPVVENNRIELATQAGIYIYDGAEGRYQGNRVLGAGLSGIVAEGAGSASFLNNTVKDSGSHGVYLTGESRGLFSANQISGNTGHGIAIDGKSRPRVENNELADNQRPQIRVSDSPDAQISGNVE